MVGMEAQLLVILATGGLVKDDEWGAGKNCILSTLVSAG